MIELDKLPFEAIRKEYWRRVSERMSKVEKWVYWTGRVIEDKALNDSNNTYLRMGYKVKPLDFDDTIVIGKYFRTLSSLKWRKSYMPNIGDIVKLRYRKHYDGNDFPNESFIVEIIKRKENVD